MNFLAELRQRLATALKPLTSDPAPYLDMLRPAQDPRFGDFQANCAMPLAKQRKRNPREVAAEIVAAWNVADLCEPPEIAGPGFINLRLRADRLTEETNRLITDERLGVPRVEQPRNYVVDFSAPNVAKPMHVGHLRSSVIGDALCRILRFLGHTVIGDNHIGDWGTQFGMIIYGYKHFRNDDAFLADPVNELARLYRLVNQLSDYHDLAEQLPKLREQLERKQSQLAELQTGQSKDAQKPLKKLQNELADLKAEITSAEKKRQTVDQDPLLKALADQHPRIAELARRETAKLHAGDRENRELWETFLPACLAALDKLYCRLGVRFDLTLGESFYQPMLEQVVNDLLASGLARESEGAICVFLEGREAPFIVRKGDGAFTYATTDLATIRYRLDELKAEEILYVVDARQSDHFAMLFETAKRMGSDRAHRRDAGATEFRHVSFGTILGEDKRPFKTRAGDTVGLESLIDEAVARARAIVDENLSESSDLGENALQDIAETVGIGGIKYADLRHNRESDYVFSWDKMLAKTGDTATYIQYANARINGIFRKGGVNRERLRQSGAAIQLTQPAERALALQVNRFAEALTDVTADSRPNILTQHLFDTANGLSTFYEQCPVLQEPDEALRTSRLLLLDLVGRVLSRGLSLLGIGAPPQM